MSTFTLVCLSMQMDVMYNSKPICLSKLKTLVLEPKSYREQRDNTRFTFYVVFFCQFCFSDKWYNYSSVMLVLECCSVPLQGLTCVLPIIPLGNGFPDWTLIRSVCKPSPALRYLVSESMNQMIGSCGICSSWKKSRYFFPVPTGCCQSGCSWRR